MSFDKNDKELSVGDTVMVECEILRIMPGMRADILEVAPSEP